MNNDVYRLMNHWFHLLEDQNNNFRTLVNSHNNLYSIMHRNNYQQMDITQQVMDRFTELQRNRTDDNSNANSNNIFNSRRNRSDRSTFGRFNQDVSFPPQYQTRHNTRPFSWPTGNIFNRSTTNTNNTTNRSQQRTGMPIWNIFNQSNLQSNIPTQLQIYDSVSNTQWREIKETTNQPLCPITQQPFYDNDDVLKILHCGHVFKKDSLLRWFQRSSLCPVCRYNIINRDFGTSDEQSSNNTLHSLTNNILSSLTTSIIGDISRNVVFTNNFLSSLNSDLSQNIVLASIEYGEAVHMNDVGTNTDELFLPIPPLPTSPINTPNNDISNNDISNNDISNNLSIDLSNNYNLFSTHH